MKFLPISAFCETGSGGTPARAKFAEYYKDGTIPWVKSGELSRAAIESTEESITDLGLSNSAAKLLSPGAILVALYGATVGQVSQLKINAATNQAICHIYPDRTICLPGYLFWVMKGSREQLLAKRVGGGQPNISQKIIRDFVVPLPTLSEQKRIAAILDAADALRAKRRESIAQLDTLLQATFLDMFGDPDSKPLPWEAKPLGSLTTKVGSGATPKGGGESYKDHGIALIRSLNVRDGEFRWKDLARIDDVQASKLSNVVVEDNDVLLNITGASVARVCRAPRTVLPARVNQHVCIIRTAKGFEAEFLENLLLTDSMKRRLLKIGESGATRQAITKAQILAIKVPVPPHHLQRRFSQFVNNLKRERTYLQEHLAELDALFASLQSRAFSGQL